MNYFKILGLLYGIIALLKPFYMHILPWDEFKGLKKTYAKKRPVWIIWVSIFGVLLTAFTWYMELTTDYKHSTIISVIMSITLIKAINLLFNYQKFHLWIKKTANPKKSNKLVLIDIVVGIIGLIIIILSLEFL